jgi:uridine kinase
VRRGEEKYIFPYQERADAMFNSALFYEIPVLKDYVVPLLRSVPNTVQEYGEAQRLLKLLDYFVTIPPTEIPPTSIIREVIGGSSCEY